MKKTILLIATAIAMLSCSALKGGSASSTTANTSTAAATTTTSTSALSAGQNAGNALLALYNQYKADGNKYDYKNLNNIINCLQLVNACEGLKETKNNKAYLKDFGKGMMVSAVGLVTESNVNSVTDQLTEMVTSNEKVNAAASTASEKLQTAAATASSISSILSMFAGK